MRARTRLDRLIVVLAAFLLFTLAAAPALARALPDAAPSSRLRVASTSVPDGVTMVNKTIRHPLPVQDVPPVEQAITPQANVYGNGNYVFYNSFEPNSPSPWATYGAGWGTTDYRRADLSYSAYCAQAFAPAPGPYPANYETWIVAGPMNLAQAQTAWLRNQMWLKTEMYEDLLFIAVSTDAEYWDGMLCTGNSNGWTLSQIDISDYCGEPNVWIAFAFASSASVVDEGVYIDGVTLTVNSAPIANADNYGTPRNTAKSVSAPGLLANDTEPNGDPLALQNYTQPAHGSVTCSGSGAFVYTPTTGFEGTDTFTYTATDHSFVSAPAVVTMTVGNAPVAKNDTYFTPIDTPAVVGAAGGVLGNDSDADGDACIAVPLTNPTHGTVTLEPLGIMTYTPNAGFEGVDSFTYRAYDGTLYSSPATVTIVVGNAAPVAANDSYAITAGTPRTVAAPGVLANDTDLNPTDILKVYRVTDVAHGSVTLNEYGSFTYTPAQGFKGTDSFTYRVYDGHTYSEPATVSFVVSLQLSPVYRFYNVSNGTHFFTPSPEEADMVLAKWPTIFQYEGPAYYMNPVNNTQPLFRFYNKSNGSHFYTASPEEANAILIKWPTIFSYDGQTYAVNPSSVPNSVPVYRFYNKKNGSHFYTASAQERDTVMARWAATYQYEGPAFWLGQ